MNTEELKLAQLIAENRIISLLTEGRTAFLFAHPDDETLFAGTSAHITRKGGKTYSYYATLGEAGMSADKPRTPKQLAKKRLEELIQAEMILGFTQVMAPNPKRLTFHDGKLPNEFDRLTKNILDKLHYICPNRVITFPPSGITGHPDHQTMLLAGWKAFHDYVQQTDHPIEFYCRVIPEWARGIEGEEKFSNLIKHDKKLVPTHYVNVKPYADIIKQNLFAHKTQLPALSTIYPVLRNNKKRIHTHEYYTRVYSRE